MKAGDTIIAWNDDPQNAAIGILEIKTKTPTGTTVYNIKSNWFLNAIKASDVEILNNKLKQTK